MRTSVPGNDGRARPARDRRGPAGAGAARQRRLGPRAAFAAGFTLIELLVVVAIIAIATAGVSFALRDSADAQLDREAQRLSALFESARARSRSTGVPVVWHSVAGGFRFEGLPPGTLPERWLGAGTVVQQGNRVVLGPDPIIGSQSVVIASQAVPQRSVRIATDGLRPFTVTTEAP